MKLTETQQGVLRGISDRVHGWIDRPYGCGWVWGTQSRTRKAAEALLKKGLVNKGDFQWSPLDTKTYPQYTLSEKGEKYLEALRD